MRRGLIAAAIALVLGAVAVVALAGTGGPPPAPATPRASAAAFLDRYVTADGRVVRRDQSGDTVSEGQSYALLLAVATGDERRFATVWRWTASHLQRPDGLLAWHWVGGRLAGRDPATDADLDAARALLVAGRRFGRPAFRAQGIRIGRAVLASETAHGVLVAGPWARGAGIVNPSYSAPRAFRSLGTATGDGRWGALAAASRSATAALTAPAPHLPPDWARMTASGPRATGAPGTSDAPDYGYDAVRVPLRLA
ncbi:MAG: endoglucanase, partial [Solirubrobacteraceae bacterium]|nr:endoglucanase [Solirubrobacteraceae bacterium]